jgi:hypothetical protein
MLQLHLGFRVGDELTAQIDGDGVDGAGEPNGAP